MKFLEMKNTICELKIQRREWTAYLILKKLKINEMEDLVIESIQNEVLGWGGGHGEWSTER